jgi:transcriptional regulator with XRE-family HTH domain
MNKKTINRLKVVLAEKQLTGKWLADQLGKSVTTVSRWCSNETQPSLEVLTEIADMLEIDIRELLNPNKN